MVFYHYFGFCFKGVWWLRRRRKGKGKGKGKGGVVVDSEVMRVFALQMMLGERDGMIKFPGTLFTEIWVSSTERRKTEETEKTRY